MDRFFKTETKEKAKHLFNYLSKLTVSTELKSHEVELLRNQLYSIEAQKHQDDVIALFDSLHSDVKDKFKAAYRQHKFKKNKLKNKINKKIDTVKAKGKYVNLLAQLYSQRTGSTAANMDEICKWAYAQIWSLEFEQQTSLNSTNLSEKIE